MSVNPNTIEIRPLPADENRSATRVHRPKARPTTNSPTPEADSTPSSYAAERLLRSVLDNARLGLALVSLDGDWLNANQRARDLLGYDQAALRQHKLQGVTEREAHKVNRQRAARSSQELTATSPLRQSLLSRKGQPVWVTLTPVRQRDSAGQPLFHVAVFEEIAEPSMPDTERAKPESLPTDEAAQAKQLVHDFNNVIAGASLNLDAALKKLPAESAARRNITTAAAMVERAAALTFELSTILLEREAK